MASLIYPAAPDGSGDIAREIAELDNFYAHNPGDYDGGMSRVTLGHVMRETAKYYDCDFADIRLPDVTQEALEQQNNSGHDILICTPQSIDKDTKYTDTENLAAALDQIRAAGRYHKVLLPIAASNYGVAHCMALAVEGNTAYIFEQLGGSAYAEVKMDISRALMDRGFQVKINPHALTKSNRLDCATVSTKIITEALSDNSVEDLYHQTINQSPLFSYQEIDEHHAHDKKLAAMALKDIQNGHRDDRNRCADIILFQQLGLSPTQEDQELIEQFWQAPDKAKFVNEYLHAHQKTGANSQNMFRFDDNPQVSEDLAWKEEYHRIFMRRAEAQDRPFVRTDQADDPALQYRLADSRCAFSSPHHGQIESDNFKDFLIMCQTVKDTGHTKVELGAFAKHPEYRARFVLACLQTGLEITNMPELESLKSYPEYAQIKAIMAPEPDERKTETETPTAETPTPEDLKARVLEAYHTLREAQEQAAADTGPGGYVELKQAYDQINRDWKKDKNNTELKEARFAARDAFLNTPAGDALHKSEEEYAAAVEAAAIHYLEKGSPARYKDQPVETTPQQRIDKMKKHLQDYDPYRFYQDNAGGKKTPRRPKEEMAKHNLAQRAMKKALERR